MINPHNLATFEGRIARDPQISTVTMGQEQVKIAMFTLAVERALSSAQRQKVKNGDKSIKTADFIPCSATGGSAEIIEKFCPVGKAITITAHYVEYQTTDGSTGQTVYRHIFEIDNIAFATQDAKSLQGNNSQSSQNSGQPATQGGYRQQNKNQPSAQNVNLFDENEEPF